MASIPYGCRYRLIDFALSNMVNAGIGTINVKSRTDLFFSLQVAMIYATG